MFSAVILSCARRSRLDAFRRLRPTLKTHFEAVVRGMADSRSNPSPWMTGLMQQAKRAARGFRTAIHFINSAYLRLSKLTHLAGSRSRPLHRAKRA